MKIAIFSDAFLPTVNGVAVAVRQSARSFSEAGHEVLTFAGSSFSKRRLQAATELNVVTLPSFPLPAYPDQRIVLPAGLALFHLSAGGFRPDVIHTHTPFGAGWEAVVAAKILKVPIVGTHHTFFDHYLKHVKLEYSWAKKFSWRAVVAYYNLCDLIISPSQAMRRELISHGLRKPTMCIPNAVDDLFFQAPPSETEKRELKRAFKIGEPSFIYMGRLSYEKSIDRVIKAFAVFSPAYPAATLMIVGDGPERQNLETLAASLGVKEKTVFTGLRLEQALLETLRASDVFVTASQSENMPLSVLEAITAGLPVIAAAENGLKEIVKDGVNGFLVPADQPESFAQKMAEFASHPDLIKKFAAASRAEAAQYGKKEITGKLIAAYRAAKNPAATRGANI